VRSVFLRPEILVGGLAGSEASAALFTASEIYIEALVLFSVLGFIGGALR
jgi:hypothetical protein